MAVFLVTLVIILIYGHHRIYTLPAKKDGEGNLLEIREKYSFEQDKKKTSHSPGVYYFASGLLLKEYCGKLVESRETLKGEYYASMVYNFMVKDGKKVWVPDCVEQFLPMGNTGGFKGLFVLYPGDLGLEWAIRSVGMLIIL